MTQHLGLRFSGVPTLAELLYFDQVAIIPRQLRQAGSGRTESRPPSHSPNVLADLDYLLDAGLVVDFRDFLPGSTRDGQVLNLYLRDSVITSAGHGLMRGWHNLIGAKARGVIENAGNYEASLLLESPREVSAKTDELGAVLEVTLDQFPTPAPDTPLERIVEFRNDEGAMRKLRALRLWATRLAKLGLRPTEIEAELRELVDVYVEHMKVHKMEFQLGAFGTLVSVPAEVLEDLLSRKPTDAIRRICGVRKCTLELTKAELQNPGRAVAYIVDAQREFSR